MCKDVPVSNVCTQSDVCPLRYYMWSFLFILIYGLNNLFFHCLYVFLLFSREMKLLYKINVNYNRKATSNNGEQRYK